jgi:FkbM family methyltransferase
MRKLIASLSRSAFLRRTAKSLRLQHAANAFLRRKPMVKELPGSGIVYRASRLESIPLAVDMLEKGSLYPTDILPSPLTSFADLGCNVGYFTCWLAHERGRALKGIMVDANPDVVREAQWHADANSLREVHALHGLAGSSGSSADFYLYDSNVCSASKPLDSALPELKGDWKKISVPALSIEKIWRERFGNLSCDLLKLDIEGSELQFVQLEANFLKSVSVIIAEWHSWGTTKEAFSEELARHGFVLRRILDESPLMGTVVFSRTTPTAS